MPLKPYKPRDLKKVPATFKLPAWLMEWLRDQDESQSKLIEQALKETFNLKPPGD